MVYRFDGHDRLAVFERWNRAREAFGIDHSVLGLAATGSRIMANKPRVSIVIPAYNEAPCLEKLHQELTAVCDMLPFPFEFLFVNDGSTDETEDVLAELRTVAMTASATSRFRATSGIRERCPPGWLLPPATR